MTRETLVMAGIRMGKMARGPLVGGRPIGFERFLLTRISFPPLLNRIGGFFIPVPIVGFISFSSIRFSADGNYNRLERTFVGYAPNCQVDLLYRMGGFLCVWITGARQTPTAHHPRLPATCLLPGQVFQVSNGRNSLPILFIACQIFCLFFLFFLLYRCCCCKDFQVGMADSQRLKLV